MREKLSLCGKDDFSVMTKLNIKEAARRTSP